jgi:transcriptional regulator with XRE-family HTH domain
MSQSFSPKQIGQRLAEFRKNRGLSQDELAKNVKISRSSLAQIELGNRGVDILELQKFSHILRFSLDHFMAKDFCVEQDMPVHDEKKLEKLKERISEPTLQVQKFKNILLYILERCAGKPNVGETVLHKLLYFSDFNYYELYEEHLSGAKYLKLPYGPIPQELDAIITQMIDKGQLQRVKTAYHHSSQTRYLPLQKANLTELKASEKEMIDQVLTQTSNWSLSSLEQYIQDDMPIKISKENEMIDYEFALYREAPYSVRNYESDMI